MLKITSKLIIALPLFSVVTFSLHVDAAAYLSSFGKFWSPSSRSLKRKRGGSGGTSLSSCSIFRAEMSKITPLLLLPRLVWSGAAEELEEWEEKSKMTEGEGRIKTKRLRKKNEGSWKDRKWKEYKDEIKGRKKKMPDEKVTFYRNAQKYSNLFAHHHPRAAAAEKHLLGLKASICDYLSKRVDVWTPCWKLCFLVLQFFVFYSENHKRLSKKMQ